MLCLALFKKYTFDSLCLMLMYGVLIKTFVLDISSSHELILKCGNMLKKLQQSLLLSQINLFITSDLLSFVCLFCLFV